MNTDRRLLLAAMAAGALPLPTRAENKTALAKVWDIYPLLDGMILYRGKKNLVELAYYINVKGGAVTDVSLTAVTPQGETPLNILPDGRIEWPPVEVYMQIPQIRVSAKTGVELGFSQRFLARLPLTKEIRLDELAQSLAETNAVVAASRHRATDWQPLNTVAFVGAASGRVERPGAPPTPLIQGDVPGAPKMPMLLIPEADDGKVVLDQPPKALMLISRQNRPPRSAGA
jgi:hypothetical protein